MCAVERELAGQLEVKRGLERAVDVKHGQVVDFAHMPDGERCRKHALADHAVASSRLDVNDHVDSGKRVVQRLLDAIGSGMALADRSSRRDADDDVGEVLPHPPCVV